MAETIIPTNLRVQGHVACTTLGVPAGTVTDAMVNGSAAVSASKCQQQYSKGYNQAHGSAAASARFPVHVARGATGTVVAFRAGVVVACIGAATIDVDLRKNGTTVLSAAIQIDSGDAAYAKVDGTLSSADYVAGDVFEVVVTATAGGGTLGQGLFVDATFREGAD